MPLRINPTVTPQTLAKKVLRLFELSRAKILNLEQSWNPERGTPVFTVKGRYTSRGWTDWTQGFRIGSALLQFEVTGDEQFLHIGRTNTVRLMASHVSHMGVHDHGFNNVSTYGNLLRLMRENKIPHDENERNFYELALKVSGAVQAARWSGMAQGRGYIYSFNGPHSLFIDTMRSLRSLAVAHLLGHVLMGEHEEKISLLGRLIEHAQTTAQFSIYYGKGRDAYDVRGRTVHECIFNPNDGFFRCPSSQQGYSPFSTWTRGLAWAVCGFAEQLEFLPCVAASELDEFGGRKTIERALLDAATATADFYLDHSYADGIPVWDTGAPNLHHLAKEAGRPADPYNRWEPVDSSAAVIAAQGLIRLGNFLRGKSDSKGANCYRQAGLTIANTLFAKPYLAENPKHQGLLLHSVYHRPNGWDYIAPGERVPNGESSMWGDYHARELGVLILREARGDQPLTFFSGIGDQARRRRHRFSL